MRRLASLVLLLPGLWACQPAENLHQTSEVLLLSNPSGSMSGMPNLSTTDGNIRLSWIDTEEGMHHLRMASLGEEGFRDVQTISSGSDWFVNWADFPGMAHFPDGRAAAYWLQKSGPGTFHYDIHWKSYQDGHWSEAKVLNEDGLRAEHGFVSMLPLPDGKLLAAWLDGRNTAQEDAGEAMHTHDMHGHTGAMSLRAALFDTDFVRLQEWELDDRICDCCQTTLASTPEGAILLYRDRSEEEIRDISYLLFDGEAWSTPQGLHADEWQIAGCPVNGPSAASHEDKVLAAWFTGAQGQVKLSYKWSTDGGKQFGPAVQLNEHAGPGRVHTTYLPERNTFAVVWLENKPPEGTWLMAAEIGKNGKLLRKWPVLKGTEARAGGFPRVAFDGENLIFAWTDDTDGRKLITAKQNLTN